MIESKGWLLLALVFTVLLVLLNLSSIEERAPSPLLGKATEEKFDYAMKGMVSYQFDQQGNLLSTLQANDLFHYPQQQIIKLNQPSVEFLVSEQSWSLNANSGTLSETSEELLFKDVVTITNSPASEIEIKNTVFQPITIEINELLLNMREQLAFSQNAVKFSSNDWKIQGNGLSIDIENQSIKILNSVEAIHDTP